MSRYARQFAAAAAQYDSAHEDDAQRYDDARAKRADAVEHATPVLYADAMREWAGMEERRAPVFHVISWQEGDPF